MIDKTLRDEMTRKGAEAELALLNTRRAALERLLSKGPWPGRREPKIGPVKRKMSAKARKAIGDAQRKRWALTREASNKKAPAPAAKQEKGRKS